ncbi:MAG: hypothetical protein AB8H03_19945 [Saprospiraceae bacterium]
MKNKTIFTLLIFFVLFNLLSSCAVKNNHYYVPSEGNVLTLSERNDLKVSASTSINDNGISNFQIGYSPIKYVGLFGSWMYQKDGKGVYPFDFSISENSNSANYKSVAIGGYFFKKRDTYYSTLIPKKYLEQGGFLVDLYVGIGEGEFKRDYQSLRAYVDFEHKKIFGQAGFHYKFRSLGISYIFKVGQLQIKNVLVHGNFITFPKNIFDELKEDNTINTYESTCRIEYGIREAKFNLSLTGFSNQVNIFSPQRSYFSAGVLVNVDEFFRKKGKTKSEFEKN